MCIDVMLKGIRSISIGVFFCVAILLCASSVSAAGTPVFSGSTPANYATTTAGASVTVSVSSTVAVGELHQLTMDWNRKLIGWWRFNSDGDVTDYSGTGNTLTNNGATWTESGKYGGAYNFDAVTDYLGVSSTTHNLSSSDPYTISVWVKPNNTSNKTVLNLGTDGSSGSYMGFLNVGAGQTVEYAMRQNFNGDWLGVTSVATVSSSTWSHVVITNDRTNLRIYINGALSNTQALGSYGTYTAVFNLFVGKNLWGDYFNGGIDDLQFYKRALSTGEIQSLYNGQTTEYNATFSSLATGTYTYRGYAQTASGTVTDTGLRTLYVNVTPPSYQLTYTAAANGSVSGSTTQMIVAGGSGSPVSAVANAHYTFFRWSDGLTTNPRTDTGISATTTITANFMPASYQVTYTAGAGGSISGSSTQLVTYNTNASSVTAVPNSGYVFSQWSDGVTTTVRTDLNVSGAINVTANFTAESSGETETQASHGGGASTSFSPAPPVVFTPPSVDGSSGMTVTNVFQMAISTSEDFAGTSWLPYDESYKTKSYPIYIKFRSPDGGVSEVFRINPRSISTEVKADLEPSKAPAKIGYAFARNLRRGMTGADVKELQKCLNEHGFTIASSGYGSKGKETTYFGTSTLKALIAFQKANNLPPTGYLGPMTRVMMK